MSTTANPTVKIVGKESADVKGVSRDIPIPQVNDDNESRTHFHSPQGYFVEMWQESDGMYSFRAWGKGLSQDQKEILMAICISSNVRAVKGHRYIQGNFG